MILSSAWVAVEFFTVWAAGFGGGPLVPVVANAEGRADVHTQRFAALLAALMGLNTYAIIKTRMGNLSDDVHTWTLAHTVLVADSFAFGLCGVVEVLEGDILAIGWHIGLMLALGWLLILRRKDWNVGMKLKRKEW